MGADGCLVGIVVTLAIPVLLFREYPYAFWLIYVPMIICLIVLIILRLLTK